jgi:2-oxoglutarate ferredoxin oxidoreductase subunit beta
MRTTTTPGGRNIKTEGYPLRVCELLATIEGVSYIERVSLDSYRNLSAAKQAIEKAFLYQIEEKGFSFVEILSPCPTDWGLTPKAALEWIRTAMFPVYPLGVFKDQFREKN